MSDHGPFYFPTSDMFGHPYAWQMYTGYAGRLVAAGLERSFPSDAEVRNAAIEMLAERYAVEDLADDPRLIADAIVEAVGWLDARSAGGPPGSEQ